MRSLILGAAFLLSACSATTIAQHAQTFHAPEAQTPQIFDVEASELQVSCAFDNDYECNKFAVVVRDVLLESINRRLKTMQTSGQPARVKLQLTETGALSTGCTALACLFTLGLGLILVPEQVDVEATAIVQVGDQIYNGTAKGSCSTAAANYTSARHCAAGQGAVNAIVKALESSPSNLDFNRMAGSGGAL